MDKFKYFLSKNKIAIIITIIVLICAIAIAIGVYAQVTNRKVIPTNEKKEEVNYEELELGFEDIFTNSITKGENAKDDINYDEIIYLGYDIDAEEANYNIHAKIPFFKPENEVTEKINSEIYDVFANTIINIVKTSTSNTTFNLDYVAYVNGDILSLVLRCKYKNGINPQRVIIQTYNYDIQNNKLLDINEIIEYKGFNKDEIEKAVIDKIKQENAQNQTIREQGYNLYMRDEDNEIYKIEKTPNFFLGQNGYLYLVYAYGNNNYTSEMDLVIF